MRLHSYPSTIVDYLEVDNRNKVVRTYSLSRYSIPNQKWEYISSMLSSPPMGIQCRAVSDGIQGTTLGGVSRKISATCCVVHRLEKCVRTNVVSGFSSTIGWSFDQSTCLVLSAFTVCSSVRKEHSMITVGQLSISSEYSALS